MAAPSALDDVEPTNARPYASTLDHLRDELMRLDMLLASQVARAREAAASDAWRGLAISEREVDALLARQLGQPPWDLATTGLPLGEAQALADRLAQRIAHRIALAPATSRLARLAARFELDCFELDVVVLALAPELDLRYERLYAYLHDDVTRKRPSVDLALHLLCGSLDDRIAAREKFAPSSTLVAHGIVQLVTDATPQAPPLLACALKLDDRLVDYVHGSDRLDRRLARHARRIAPARGLDELFVAAPTRAALARAAEIVASEPALIYVCGPRGAGKTGAAEAIASATGRGLLVLDVSTLDGLPDDVTESHVRAAAREARLYDDLLLVEHADRLVDGERRLAREALLDIVAESSAPLVLAAETRWEPRAAQIQRTIIRIELGIPDASIREQLWRAALADAPLAADASLARLAGSLRLGPSQIHDAAATARSLARARMNAFAGALPSIDAADLEEACRLHAGTRFGSHARRIAARPTWDDLVLAEDRLARLRELCDHARYRARVLEEWGFGKRLPNGKGLGMLFVGAPGTGKTLAASIIATELGLELYRVDLASVVSKWIGETEKHLARIFEEAERGHAILLFDEADALFAKRSEVHDAHDRYANLETSYLLQRIEDYDGIVILASNLRNNLDEAFVRRLRFIIEFPMPDERERLLIWQRIWPPDTPLARDLDLATMARRFELAGAHIRNIALAAAFLAASENAPVAQRHLLHATRREYQKLGRMIDESMFRERQ